MTSARIPLLLAALALALQPPAAGTASAAPPDCEALAARAAHAEDLPAGLLPAIARVESGKRVGNGVKAWPWTLNQGGAGSYHATEAEALAKLADILATGRTNVDVGCMQLNWRWHADAFPDAATMMDPVENTRYAARFLRELHTRHGSWPEAVAHYHSADPVRGAAYAERVDRVMTQQAVAKATPAPETPEALAVPQPGDAGRTASAHQQGILVRPAGSLLVRANGGDMRHARAPGFGLVVPLGGTP